MMSGEKKEKERPKSIVLEVQSLTQELKTTFKQEKNNGKENK